MARPSKFSAEKKQQIVLSVLRGELKITEAARRYAASEVSIARWRDLFVEGGVAALKNGSRVELRILKRGGLAGFATRSWR